jgi:hypothetical protein
MSSLHSIIVIDRCDSADGVEIGVHMLPELSIHTGPLTLGATVLTVKREVGFTCGISGI